MKKIMILSITTIAMLTFSGCGDKSKEEGAKSAVEVAKEATTKTVDAAKNVAKTAVDKTKEAATATTEAVKETATKATEATKEAATATAEKAKEAVATATEAVKEKAKEAVAGGNDKGKAVFAKCVSCHGSDGKTKALGKSEIIAGQAAADIEKKLQEYKAGTRNVAGMGMLMKGQAGPLSDEDIKAVAEYISSLK